jgi:hypothetical protein
LGKLLEDDDFLKGTNVVDPIFSDYDFYGDKLPGGEIQTPADSPKCALPQNL